MKFLAQRIFFALMLLSCISCGNWVAGYELGPNDSLEFNIASANVHVVIGDLKELGKKHQFEYVVNDYAEGKAGAYAVLMRKANFRVHATNVSDPAVLHVIFYKSRWWWSRPSDAELDTLMSDFSETLLRVEGVKPAESMFRRKS